MLEWFRKRAAVDKTACCGGSKSVHAVIRCIRERAWTHYFPVKWITECTCVQRESFDVIGRMGFDHDFGVSRCVALTEDLLQTCHVTRLPKPLPPC